MCYLATLADQAFFDLSNNDIHDDRKHVLTFATIESFNISDQALRSS